MALDPGKLRHRVRIDQRRDVQGAASGTMTTKWKTFLDNVPAAIEPLSVNSFIASQQAQSNIVARITIRYVDGLLPTMRIVGLSRPYLGRVFDPAGWLNDADDGSTYVTAPCSEGVNEGE